MAPQSLLVLLLLTVSCQQSSPLIAPPQPPCVPGSRTRASCKQRPPLVLPLRETESMSASGTGEPVYARTTPAGDEPVSQNAPAFQARMNPVWVLVHLTEFGLACLLSAHADRECLEKLLGEPLPEPLWQEFVAAAPRERVDIEEAGDEPTVVRAVLGMLALSCIAQGRGGRASLEEHLTRPFSDEAWSELALSVRKALPTLRDNWQQMRMQKRVVLPDSLFEPPEPSDP